MHHVKCIAVLCNHVQSMHVQSIPCTAVRLSSNLAKSRTTYWDDKLFARTQLVEPMCNLVTQGWPSGCIDFWQVSARSDFLVCDPTKGPKGIQFGVSASGVYAAYAPSRIDISYSAAVSNIVHSMGARAHR